MKSGTLTIVHKEWQCFIGSDKGIFLLYAVLMFSWSIMLATPQDTSLPTGALWLVFFSIVISANFSNTVFIAERVHGILEILLTSGLSRKHILYGKMLFVGGMSCIIGLLCITLSYIWRIMIHGSFSTSILSVNDIILYICAVYMNTGSSAYLSVRMGNPRLLHLTNLLLLGSLVTLYTVFSYYFAIPSFALSLLLIILGGIGTIAARRLYESEKILKPVLW
jgi:ABC-type Na+ efflux pump permease subunit